jgi:hypothetical protein
MSGNDLEPQPNSSVPAPIVERTSGIWMWSLAAGLLAGLATWAGGELVWGRVHSAQTPRIIAFPTVADHDRVIHGLVSSTAVSFIQQGAILGAAFGLAGGLTRRSVRVGLIAAIVGGLLGALASALTAYVLLGVHFRNADPVDNSLTLALLVHGGIWAGIGAAAGLAFGLGVGDRGRWARGAFGGLVGGAAAAMAYDVVGALVFPLDKTSQPISATIVTRLLAQLLVAVFVAAGAAVGASDSARRGPTPS